MILSIPTQVFIALNPGIQTKNSQQRFLVKKRYSLQYLKLVINYHQYHITTTELWKQLCAHITCVHNFPGFIVTCRILIVICALFAFLITDPALWYPQVVHVLLHVYMHLNQNPTFKAKDKTWTASTILRWFYRYENKNSKM